MATAALLTALSQATLGGVVRVSGSGLGCPDWPLCHGRIVPPFDLETMIEYSHRLTASFLGLLAVAVTGLVWVYYRSDLRIVVAALLGLALVVAAAILGGVTVLTELSRWMVLLHLGLGELLVGCLVVVTVLGWHAGRAPAAASAERAKPRGNDRLNLLVLATLVGVFILILSGSYMVGYGAGSSCATWPLCRGSLMPGGETAYAVHMGHRYLSVVAGVLIVATIVSAVEQRNRRPEVAWAGAALAALFVIQVGVGAATVWSGFAPELKGLHLGMATLVWGATVSLASLIYYRRPLSLRVGSSVRPVSEPQGLGL